MEPNKTKGGAKDFFLNLGAIIALYTVVASVLNLLFTVINVAYPQIGYYYGTQSISWPVAVLIIAFPILIVLMWLLSKDYSIDPEKKTVGIHKWLSYITIFIAGLVLAGDLITVLYYFLDGQELTAGFLLKVLSVLVVALCLFMYYISDIRGKLTSKSHMIWRIVAAVVVIGSIILGFSVIGSPRTQRMIKYDEQKVMDLQNINSQIQNYYQMKVKLPPSLADLSIGNSYFIIPVDSQTNKSYGYTIVALVNETLGYELCAEFNLETVIPSGYGARPSPEYSWDHPAGHYCFTRVIDKSFYPPVKLPM